MLDASPFSGGTLTPSWVLPDQTFSRPRFDLELEDRTLELRHFGGAHGQRMIVMRLPQERILFIVDLVTPKTVGFRILPDYQSLKLIQTLQAIESDLESQRIVPGHLGPVALASAVAQARQFFEDQMAAVRGLWSRGSAIPADWLGRSVFPTTSIGMGMRNGCP